MTKKPAWSFSALSNFESCPKKFWHLRVARDHKEPEGEALLYGKKVHKALELFVAKGTPLPDDLAHLQKHVELFANAPLDKYVEQQLAINESLQPTGWFDKDVWCRAVLDLALVGKRRALLVDYKTGKMKDDGFTQLKLAAALFLIHYPDVQDVEVAYLWTQHKGVTTRETYSRSQITEIWNELLPRVSRFVAAHERTEFPAVPSPLCRYCPVSFCPHNG